MASKINLANLAHKDEKHAKVKAEKKNLKRHLEGEWNRAGGQPELQGRIVDDLINKSNHSLLDVFNALGRTVTTYEGPKKRKQDVVRHARAVLAKVVTEKSRVQDLQAQIAAGITATTLQLGSRTFTAAELQKAQKVLDKIVIKTRLDDAGLGNLKEKQLKGKKGVKLKKRIRKDIIDDIHTDAQISTNSYRDKFKKNRKRRKVVGYVKRLGARVAKVRDSNKIFKRREALRALFADIRSAEHGVRPEETLSTLLHASFHAPHGAEDGLELSFEDVHDMLHKGDPSEEQVLELVANALGVQPKHGASLRGAVLKALRQQAVNFESATDSYAAALRDSLFTGVKHTLSGGRWGYEIGVEREMWQNARRDKIWEAVEGEFDEKELRKGIKKKADVTKLKTIILDQTNETAEELLFKSVADGNEGRMGTIRKGMHWLRAHPKVRMGIGLGLLGAGLTASVVGTGGLGAFLLGARGLYGRLSLGMTSEGLIDKGRDHLKERKLLAAHGGAGGHGGGHGKTKKGNLTQELAYVSAKSTATNDADEMNIEALAESSGMSEEYVHNLQEMWEKHREDNRKLLDKALGSPPITQAKAEKAIDALIKAEEKWLKDFQSKRRWEHGKKIMKRAVSYLLVPKVVGAIGEGIYHWWQGDVYDPAQGIYVPKGGAAAGAEPIGKTPGTPEGGTGTPDGIGGGKAGAEKGWFESGKDWVKEQIWGPGAPAHPGQPGAAAGTTPQSGLDGGNGADPSHAAGAHTGQTPATPSEAGTTTPTPEHPAAPSAPEAPSAPMDPNTGVPTALTPDQIVAHQTELIDNGGMKITMPKSYYGFSGLLKQWSPDSVGAWTDPELKKVMLDANPQFAGRKWIGVGGRELLGTRLDTEYAGEGIVFPKRAMEILAESGKGTMDSLKAFLGKYQ